MKKLILALLTVGTLATTAGAQEPKSILVYGDAMINTTKDSAQAAHDVSKTTNWNVNAGVGYQFNRNWTLGIALGWGQQAEKNVDGEKNTLNDYHVGPFARYSRYFGHSETFFWYGQFDFDYEGGYHTHEGDAADMKHNGVFLGVYPAIGINVSHALCLNFNVGGVNFTSDKYTSATNATNTFNANFGHQLNIGISKNFNTGHKMHSHHEPGDEVHHRKMEKSDDDDDSAAKPKKKERSRDDDE